MTITSRQWLQIGVTAAALGAAGLGGVLASSPTAPQLVPSPAQASGDTVYEYRATIAVDTQTGRLVPAYMDTRYSNPQKGTYWCGVATQIKPTYRRALMTHVIAPASYNAACALAFAQWDSAEAVTHGRWPKP